MAAELKVYYDVNPAATHPFARDAAARGLAGFKETGTSVSLTTDVREIRFLFPTPAARDQAKRALLQAGFRLTPEKEKGNEELLEA